MRSDLFHTTGISTKRNDLTASERRREERSTGILERVRSKPPVRYRVWMLNDDYSTVDFVIEMLRDVFYKPYEEAYLIMLDVHHRGKGDCGVFTWDEAQSKISKVHAQAEDRGYPLRCEAEPV